LDILIPPYLIYGESKINIKQYTIRTSGFQGGLNTDTNISHR